MKKETDLRRQVSRVEAAAPASVCRHFAEAAAPAKQNAIQRYLVEAAAPAGRREDGQQNFETRVKDKLLEDRRTVDGERQRQYTRQRENQDGKDDKMQFPKDYNKK